MEAGDVGGVISEAKDDDIAKQDAWSDTATANNFRCKRCTYPIPAEEMRIYRATGYCGTCDNTTSKDE